MAREDIRDELARGPRAGADPEHAGGLRARLRRRLAGRAALRRHRAGAATTIPTCRGGGSCAPTARSPRAPASARCWRPRGSRSGAIAWTCARRACPTRHCRAVWLQREITLRAARRAASTSSPARCSSALPELGDVRAGLLHLFIRHTSASLTLNENASPDVRDDFEACFNDGVPRGRALLDAHVRGPRRHAGAHQGVAARSLALAAGLRRPARARHLAGHLPVRAPRPRRRPLACSRRCTASG